MKLIYIPFFFQGAPSSPENGDAGNFPQESSLIDQQQNAEVMTGEQYPQQGMAYKKVNAYINNLFF